MTSHIVLDDELISEAFLITTIKTKRELVDQALKEFVSHRKRIDLHDLKGMGELTDNYDYKKLRTDN